MSIMKKKKKRQKAHCGKCELDKDRWEHFYDTTMLNDSTSAWFYNVLTNNKPYPEHNERFMSVRERCIGCGWIWIIKHEMLVNLLAKLEVKVA